MKMDVEYTHIDVCPKTGDKMSDDDIYWGDGVCPHCGHRGGNMAHYKQIVGRWNTPSFYERIFQGKRAEFLTKEEEDKVMNALKGDF